MSGTRYAILIGSSEFPEEPRLNPLRCPLNDVDGMAEVLASPEYGGFSEVAVFKNRPHTEINFKLNEVLNQATKDDFVLIYYSGHGKLDRSGRLHLTTSDTRLDVLGATSIAWPRVVDYLRDAYTTKVAVLLDCCYGGAAGASFRSTVEDQIQQATQARGTYVMTAATSTELAREKEQDEYGLFTKHVIEGIKTGDADLDGDGQISMDDLYRYVQEHLREEGGQQPTMTGIDVRGELYIAKSKHSRRDERLTKVRKRLYSLAAKEVVADELVKSAIEIATLKPGEMTEEQKRLDGLLDQFLAGKLKVGELGRQWYKSAAPVDAPPLTPKAAGPPAPKPDFDLQPTPVPTPMPISAPTPKPARTAAAARWAVALAVIGGVGLFIFLLSRIQIPSPKPKLPDLTKLKTATDTGVDVVPTGTTGSTGAGIDTTLKLTSDQLETQIASAESAGQFRKAAELCRQGAEDFEDLRLKFGVREFKNWVECDEGRAISVGDALFKGIAHDDSLSLNTMAWSVVKDRMTFRPGATLMQLATDMAERAASLTSFRDPYKLDTLAFALFKGGGDIERARRLESMAITFARDDKEFPADELRAMAEREDRMWGR